MADTKLLLHMDGADASTTFTDEVIPTHVFTAFGNAQIDTAQSKFGGASGLFDGTGDYITTPNSANFDPGTGSFTAEMWVRPAVLSGADGNGAYLIGNTDFVLGSLGWLLNINATNIRFYANYTASWAINIGGAHGMSINTWYHVAVVRNGSAIDVYVNGVSKANVSNAADITSPNVLALGRNVNSDAYLYNGHMDEVRYSSVARWTANFTPPTVAYSLEGGSGLQSKIW